MHRATRGDMPTVPGSCDPSQARPGRSCGRPARHPEAAVIVHPESPPAVIDLADVVGSTSALIEAVRTMPNPTFIVATDKGIFHKMRELAPGKRLLEAPTAGEGATCESCAHCPWMAMNGLRNLVEVLESGTNEIHVDPGVGERAVVPVRRIASDFFRRVHRQVGAFQERVRRLAFLCLRGSAADRDL